MVGLKNAAGAAACMAVVAWACASACGADAVNPEDWTWTEAKDLGVEGRPFDDGEAPYGRLPRGFSGVPRNVLRFGRHSTGMCVRFVPEDDVVRIRCEMDEDCWKGVADDLYMTTFVQVGLDWYLWDGKAQAWEYGGHAKPSKVDGSIDERVRVQPGVPVLVNFPLRGIPRSVRFGVRKGHRLGKDRPHALSVKPVVHYGTSIVHGGCVSRPGLCLTAQASRLADVEWVNLGFSGSARMEMVMCTNLVARIDASLYILDCLWNMDLKLLHERFEPFVRELRHRRPAVPILLCEDVRTDVSVSRKGLFVRSVYDKLIAEGWTRLYLLKTDEILPGDPDLTLDRCHPNDAGAKIMARVYADRVKRILGDTSAVCPVAESENLLPLPRRIRLAVEKRMLPMRTEFAFDEHLPPEGYRLAVEKDAVVVTFADEAGAFYARQTLDAIRFNGKTRIVEIEDHPAYGWRGLMLDEARHFFGKDVVKRFLDRMALLKLNRFHWHLTDHQAWRLQLNCFPELSRLASSRNVAEWRRLRPDGWLDPDVETYGPYGYTQEDVREILAYAAERHIVVVPEIEIPGHCRALLKAMPQLQCSGVSNRLDEVESGYRCAVLCAGNDETLSVYEKILDEVCAMFPSPVIHIGGDEVRKDFWKDCPRCQNRIRLLGLSDESELQDWLMRHFERYLAGKGRRVVGWDEMTEGTVSTNAIATCWRGRKFACQAAERGHDVIMCPEEFCYFDFRQGEDDDGLIYHPKGNREFKPVTVEKVYSFNPSEWFPDHLKSCVLGAQGNNWTELTLDEDTLDKKLWRRAAALAEVLWSDPRVRDADAFRTRLNSFLLRGKIATH